MDSLILALSGQRFQDSAAVADRISGVENKLASLAENMAAVLLAVQGLQQGGKGYGKTQGPYDPVKGKTLIQSPTVEPTAPAGTAAVDDGMDTNNSEQTRSEQSAEA